MKYLASCSFGKDSLATVILALEHGLHLDTVVYARVMFDKYTSAEPPEHNKFIHDTAIPKLKEWGLPTIVVDSPKTFKECFLRVRSRGKNVGKYVGFPIPGWCEIQRDCKMPAIRTAQKMFTDEDVIWYLGIAKDEPKRLLRLKDNQKSLLNEFGYTESMAADLCKSYGLYSPAYMYSNRIGCFFCPNQREKELKHLYDCYPDLWNELMDLSKVKNKADNRFTRTETIEEINERFREKCL